jgi:hypothetical protein
MEARIRVARVQVYRVAQCVFGCHRIALAQDDAEKGPRGSIVGNRKCFPALRFRSCRVAASPGVARCA